jgi:hypothetical protein
MWIFTKFGFFSVVREAGNDTLMVRARVHADLVQAVRYMGIPDGAIVRTPMRDYPYRVFVTRKQVATLVLESVGADVLDYTNFKSEVAVTPGQGRTRANLYHDVWEVMCRAEDGLARLPLTPPHTPVPAPRRPSGSSGPAKRKTL